MISEKLVSRFAKRFEGFHEAYGFYNKDAAVAEILGGKVEIKSSAVTKRGKGLNWDNLWGTHLDGETPLGVIPIDAENKCCFGAIDIDDYSVDISALYNKLDKEGAQVIITRSKSDGAHVWAFFNKRITATAMQMGLQSLSALVGYGGSEIFPKQRQVAVERGDLGSWINMPYFGDTRWAVRRDGSMMTPDEFIDECDRLAAVPAWLGQGQHAAPKSEKVTSKEAEFKDGPPCLQHFSRVGLVQGSRNEGMMAFGVFAKKKYPNSWEQEVERWNREFVDPPLNNAEMGDILKSLRSKEYFYPCKKQPIVAVCQSALCRTRKHGVASGSNGMPVIGGLSVLPTDPPLWFMDVGEHRIELTTQELVNYRNFQTVCTDRFYMRFEGMKQQAWDLVLAEAMREVNKIEVSEEVGYGGQFIEILDDFINNHKQSNSREEILLGLPWLDDEDEKAEQHKYWFRLKDLQKFLNDANFKIYTRGQMVTRLRAIGGESGFFNLNGKGTRVWSIPRGFAAKTVTPTPRQPAQDPI